MNKRNHDLFFNENNDQEVIISLEDEDGEEIQAQVIIAVEVKELGKEFVAVTPMDEDEDEDSINVIALEYEEDEEGNPMFTPIQDEEEGELAVALINQALADMLAEDDEDDEEEVIDEGNYLDGISDLLPGVSIDYDK